MNSVTQDIFLLVWNEFSYRLAVIHAAGGGYYKLYCDYKQNILSIIFVTIFMFDYIDLQNWVHLFESLCTH
jgi:hypothetical protein